jgi:hypothetical protein
MSYQAKPMVKLKTIQLLRLPKSDIKKVYDLVRLIPEGRVS